MEVSRGRLASLNHWIGRGISWLTLLMVLLTCLIVLLRKFFDYGSIAMQESVIYLHAIVFMLGAGYTLAENQHVRVDVFYSRFNARTRAWVDFLGTLLLLIPLCLFLFIVSLDYVLASWGLTSSGWTGRLEQSPEAGGLPLVYLLKTVIPLMCLLLFWQALITLFTLFPTLRSDTHTEAS